MRQNFFWRKNARFGKFYFIILVLIGVAFAAGFIVGSHQANVILPRPVQISIQNQAPPQNLTVDFALFWDVWQRVTTSHLDRAKFDPVKLVEGAISGLVAATGDPYSAFLTPTENTQVKAELAGIYEGVGVQIGAKNEKIVVIAPLSGTPAADAGVRAGDAILKIDDRQTFGLSLPEAVSLIRGVAGTRVKLTLQRGETPAHELELTRAKITVKSVELSFEPFDNTQDQIAILKLSRFGEGTNSEWDEAIQKILERSAAGLVLDLRNNPGGFLQGAVYVAQDLVTGRIVGQQDSNGKSEFFKSEKKPKLGKIPTVVLVNGGTASASEIVAGALQEKKRAKLVGEPTFGKGTVQDAQELTGGAGLHLTIAKWLLPSGKDINGSGLVPDIEVKFTEGETDNQAEIAKEILKGMI